MAYLLSNTFLFKRIFSPNFYGSQNLKLTHIDKNNRKVMFFHLVSVHKRKKISKNFNKQYISTKILNFNNGKKNRGAMCPTNRRKGGGEEVCHWSKEVCYMIGTTRDKSELW
jgi:hypothetical protein